MAQKLHFSACHPDLGWAVIEKGIGRQDIFGGAGGGPTGKIGDFGLRIVKTGCRQNRIFFGNDLRRTNEIGLFGSGVIAQGICPNGAAFFVNNLHFLLEKKVFGDRIIETFAASQCRFFINNLRSCMVNRHAGIKVVI